MEINENSCAKNNENSLKCEVMKFATDIICNLIQNNNYDIENVKRNIVQIYDVIYDKIDKNSNNEKNSLNIDPNKTVFPDYIICLEDGKKLKILKRHLWSQYKMTLNEYKKKWGLDYNYPSVAPNYALVRKEIAKKSRNKNK